MTGRSEELTEPGGRAVAREHARAAARVHQLETELTGVEGRGRGAAGDPNPGGGVDDLASRRSAAGACLQPHRGQLPPSPRAQIRAPRRGGTRLETARDHASVRQAADRRGARVRSPGGLADLPVHSQPGLTAACVRALVTGATVPYELIVVDDTATAPTKDVVAQIAGATVIVNDENLGYTRSLNRGAGLARAPLLMFLNDDIVPEPGWLEAMVDCARSFDDIGVVVPMYLDPGGGVKEAGSIVWRDGSAENFGRGDECTERSRYRYRRDVDYGSGACMLVRGEPVARDRRPGRAVLARLLRGRRPLLRGARGRRAGRVRAARAGRPRRGRDCRHRPVEGGPSASRSSIALRSSPSGGTGSTSSHGRAQTRASRASVRAARTC